MYCALLSDLGKQDFMNTTYSQIQHRSQAISRKSSLPDLLYAETSNIHLPIANDCRRKVELSAPRNSTQDTYRQHHQSSRQIRTHRGRQVLQNSSIGYSPNLSRRRLLQPGCLARSSAIQSRVRYPRPTSSSHQCCTVGGPPPKPQRPVFQVLQRQQRLPQTRYTGRGNPHGSNPRHWPINHARRGPWVYQRRTNATDPASGRIYHSGP
jgi:hypothetical protein